MRQNLHLHRAKRKDAKAIKSKRDKPYISLSPSISRDYWTRTSDPYVPNVVRYQLR